MNHLPLFSIHIMYDIILIGLILLLTFVDDSSLSIHIIEVNAKMHGVVILVDVWEERHFTLLPAGSVQKLFVCIKFDSNF